MPYDRIAQLQAQNEALMQELTAYRNQCKVYERPHVNGFGDEFRGTIAPEEIRLLVNNLETELLNEKNKNSRQINDYRREVAHLQAELSASTACQRNLSRRIEQLTNELSVFKRQRPPSLPESRPFALGARAASACLSRYQWSQPNDNRSKPGQYGHISRRDSQPRGGSLDLLPGVRKTGAYPNTVRTSSNFVSRGISLPIRRVGSASPHLCRPIVTPVSDSVRHRLDNASRSREPSTASFKPSDCSLRSRSCSKDRTSLSKSVEVSSIFGYFVL
ncbi:unnamed protein product [Echinostoma caproni]|uniref:CCDC92 domain-containing protein n=1 Tax=Echinostoma caproni TaxID=27848 RepID=A0A183AW36_9TREM|nr:unnamed protein product [Echinostoma caproni]